MMKKIHDRSARGRASFYRGQYAEWLAGVWLVLHGYWPLAWRYRTKVGEIDWICRKGRTLVFVEVKARTDDLTAKYAISPRGQQRITAAARHFMASRPQARHQNIRFDALLLVPGRWPHHIKSAWIIGDF